MSRRCRSQGEPGDCVAGSFGPAGEEDGEGDPELRAELRVLRKKAAAHLADAQARLKTLLDRKATTEDYTAKIRLEMGEAMNEHLAVFRDQQGMTTALAKIGELMERHEKVAVAHKGSVYNTDLIFHIELTNMLDASEAICATGLLRKESRGAHFRRDMPERNDGDWLLHTTAVRKDGHAQVGTLPVTITEHKPVPRVY